MIALAEKCATAQLANPALLSLSFLIGNWRTTGIHPMRPEVVLNGRTSFDWFEGGAFLKMRSHIDDPDFADGLALIGSDNIAQTFGMTYFEAGGASRLFKVTIGKHSMTWRRYDQPLSYCNMIIAAEDGRTMLSTGRMCDPGGPWEEDFLQTFLREDAADNHSDPAKI